MNDDNNKKIKESLIKLYLKIKLPLKNKEKKDFVNEEKKDHLFNQSILTLIEYISSIYDISLTMKIDEEVKNYINSTNLKDLNNFNDYELLLRKLENDIRHHISIENQIKLYGEKITIKLEELEKDNEILSNKIKQISKENDELILKNKKLIEQNNNLKLLNEEYEKKIKYNLNGKLKNISLIKNKLVNKISLKLSNFHKSQINFFYGKKNNNLDLNQKKNLENQFKLNNSNNSFSYKSKIKIIDEENFHNNNKVIEKVLEKNKNDFFLKENTRNFICKKTKSVNLKKDIENFNLNEKNFISKVLIEKNGNNFNNDLFKNNKLFKNDKNLFSKKIIKEISKNNINIPFVNNLNNSNNFLIYNGIDITDNSNKKNNLIKKNINSISKRGSLNKSSVI